MVIYIVFAVPSKMIWENIMGNIRQLVKKENKDLVLDSVLHFTLCMCEVRQTRLGIPSAN